MVIIHLRVRERASKGAGLVGVLSFALGVVNNGAALSTIVTVEAGSECRNNGAVGRSEPTMVLVRENSMAISRSPRLGAKVKWRKTYALKQHAPFGSQFIRVKENQKCLAKSMTH